jgi:peptide-N4-(N-acetyl-beta-glucosaminyl)asparagine amidase
MGRCGEWANCFCALLTAIGCDARLVEDSTDHIWAEFWSEEQGRYVHVDPCENLIDRPLVYEQGWGKKLEWIVAIGVNQCVDVTRRYTRKWAEVLGRRREVPEQWTEDCVAFLNRQWMRTLPEGEREEIEIRHARDQSTIEELGRDVTPEERLARISGSQ